MPAPLAKGVIITVSILLAAGLAVYENPNIREWIDRSRHRIAMALHSLGDDVDPQPRSRHIDDPSMREDASEAAEARRRQVRAEIMERGRVMEERRRKRTSRSCSDSRQSCDNVFDKDGTLKKDEATQAASTAVEPTRASERLTNRQNEPQGQEQLKAVDSAISLRQLSPQPTVLTSDTDPFTSRYEQETRNAWNLPSLDTGNVALSGHTSESLLDFTPTSEFPPDPNVSIPEGEQSDHEVNGVQYFCRTAWTFTHTPSNDQSEFYYAHPSNPDQPIAAVALQTAQSQIPVSVSSAPSIAGSMDHVHASDIEESEDGVVSELGDGINTPGSAWTDVGSAVSDSE